MTYRLSKLAPGSYDVILNGVIIARLVRARAYRADRVRWVIELLADLPPGERPVPFTEQEHEFQSLEEVCDWLGVAQRPSGLRSEALIAPEQCREARELLKWSRDRLGPKCRTNGNATRG